MTNLDCRCRPLAKPSWRAPTVTSSALVQCFPIGFVLATMPPRDRDRCSSALRILSTITPESCPCSAGIDVHVALETPSTISRNNQACTWAQTRSNEPASGTEQTMQARSTSAIRNDASSIDATSVLRNEVQAAAFLGISPRALQKWRVTGGGPQYLRLSSRCIRYSQAELVRWIEARVCRATAEYAARQR
jgi:predicted DNA-binding transcriptional regulator AlpA